LDFRIDREKVSVERKSIGLTSKKSRRMAQEEKVASKRRKTLERELDWVRQ
jgi:hypothetical protein